MPDIIQNTLYLLTPGSYVNRDHLTLQIETPEYPAELPREERAPAKATGRRQLAVPIHHLESICVFGPSTISPPAMDLCWEHGVAINYLSETGYFQARVTGIADTSVTLRRVQFRVADDPGQAAAIARQMVAGKIQNARNSLLRAGRESAAAGEQPALERATDDLARSLRELAAVNVNGGIPDKIVEGTGPVAAGCGSDIPVATGQGASPLDRVRGSEGLAAQIYFSVFTLLLKQQRAAFAFTARTRRPPRDRINCLLSFLYALVRHDCIAALTSIGLDPFVGFLHADRPNRPSLALDLMEEFRPWLADRLAVTLINRQQIQPAHFALREGGAVEFTEAGRRVAIKAYQERKQETFTHPLLDQTWRIAQMPFVQARCLARHLRGDLPAYLPLVPK